MQAGDYGEERSEPWTYRTRILPLRTYCGRVVHRRQKHYFKVSDAARILAGLEPLAEESSGDWASNIIQTLRTATIYMLQRILPFLEKDSVTSLYDWCIEMLDQFFLVDRTDEEKEFAARRLIIQTADRAGLTVKISK